MGEISLAEQLRQCAKHKPGPLDPHWVDHAKMLMKWAADALDAADAALAENYRAARTGGGNA